MGELQRFIEQFEYEYIGDGLFFDIKSPFFGGKFV